MDADGVVTTGGGQRVALSSCDGLDSKRVWLGFTWAHLCGGGDIGKGNGSRCEVRAGGVEMNFVSDDVGKCVMLPGKSKAVSHA